MRNTVTDRWRGYADALTEDAQGLPEEASLLLNAAGVIRAAAEHFDAATERALRKAYGKGTES